jgi:hypothetical protein
MPRKVMRRRREKRDWQEHELARYVLSRGLAIGCLSQVMRRCREKPPAAEVQAFWEEHGEDVLGHCHENRLPVPDIEALAGCKS